jgi:hypothetical protein
MSRAVIQDHLQIQILLAFPVDPSQKIQKLPGAVALGNAASHPAHQDAKSRVQGWLCCGGC